jgi:hypothetical protein
MANLPEIQLRYRVHTASVTGNSANATATRTALRAIDLKALSLLGVTPTASELDLHQQLRSGPIAPLDEFERWLSKLKDANLRVNLYPQQEFEQTIAKRWFYVCHVARGWGALKWRRMRFSQLGTGLRVSTVDFMKFALRVR